MDTTAAPQQDTQAPGVTSYSSRYWLQISKQGRGKAPVARLVSPGDGPPPTAQTELTGHKPPSSYISALGTNVSVVDNDRLQGYRVSGPDEAVKLLSQQTGAVHVAAVPWIRKPQVRCYIGESFNIDTFMDHHSDALYALYCDVTVFLRKCMVHSEPSYVEFVSAVTESLHITRADADVAPDDQEARVSYAPEEDLPLEIM